MKKHKHNENIDLENSQNNPFASKEAEKDASEQIADEEKNDEFKEKYEQLNNQYIRLSADFDNYRKRQAQQLESLLKYSAKTTLKKMVPVLDVLEKAKKTVEETQDINVVKESFTIMSKQFLDALQKAGLEVIDEKDVEFDPNFHNAIIQTPNSEKEDNTILDILTKGYKLEDRVIRPAMVNVAVSEK